MSDYQAIYDAVRNKLANSQAKSFDEDGFWLECVRRSGSNSAVSGWHDIVEFLASGRADKRALSGMQAALRSLSQACGDQLAAIKEIERLARFQRGLTSPDDMP